MRGTGTPDPITLRPATSAWHNLAWKALVALLILLLMSLGIPVSAVFVWGSIWGTLLVWGGLVVAIAASNLFDELQGGLRWAWVALSVGAYGALSVPGIAGQDPSKLVDALGPVVALTLVAHLVRRDLVHALRDWALVVGLALYVALGIAAMWLVVSSFVSYGLVVFVIAVLMPPLILEGTLLLLRRIMAVKDNLRGWGAWAAVVLSTAFSIAVLSLTQLNRSTPLFVSLIFDFFAALLIGGALLVSLFTRPMIEAASGTSSGSYAGINIGRALVELSHGAILISLAIYIPLRLVAGAGG